MLPVIVGALGWKLGVFLFAGAGSVAAGALQKSTKDGVEAQQRLIAIKETVQTSEALQEVHIPAFGLHAKVSSEELATILSHWFGTMNSRVDKALDAGTDTEVMEFLKEILNEAMEDPEFRKYLHTIKMRHAALS